MVRPRRPPPERFGLLTAPGLLMLCRHCPWALAIHRSDVLRLWGERGRPKEVGDRQKCRRCGKVGMDFLLIEDSRHFIDEPPRERGPLDQLVFLIRTIKPRGVIR